MTDKACGILDISRPEAVAFLARLEGLARPLDMAEDAGLVRLFYSSDYALEQCSRHPEWLGHAAAWAAGPPLDPVEAMARLVTLHHDEEGLMKALNNEEKVGVALYYSNQEVVPQPVKDAALVARGKAYYDKICFRCHGERGHGSEAYARIAGQQVEYLSTTLKRYRDGSAARADAIMASNTRLMTDADIQAVVAYVSSMK